MRRPLSTVERKIRRLTREIAEIDAFLHDVKERDRSLVAGTLERKRDDIVRAAVLQLHTAIEDVLTSYLICRVLGAKTYERVRKMRTRPGRALRRMLYGAGSLGFDMKLNFAVALGLLNETAQRKLMELNTLRNKCSHNWLLRVPTRHGRRPRQKKPPLLLWRGGDLHQFSVLKSFCGEFGPLYVKLFLKYLDCDEQRDA